MLVVDACCGPAAFPPPCCFGIEYIFHVICLLSKSLRLPVLHLHSGLRRVVELSVPVALIVGLLCFSVKVSSASLECATSMASVLPPVYSVPLHRSRRYALLLLDVGRTIVLDVDKS
jgi:hypothetical protein